MGFYAYCSISSSHNDMENSIYKYVSDLMLGMSALQKRLCLWPYEHTTPKQNTFLIGSIQRGTQCE